MKKILILVSALCVTVSGLLMVVSAQDDITPEQRAAQAVDQRKALFKTLRFNLIPIAGMAQGAPLMRKSPSATHGESPRSPA